MTFCNSPSDLATLSEGMCPVCKQGLDPQTFTCPFGFRWDIHTGELLRDPDEEWRAAELQRARRNEVHRLAREGRTPTGRKPTNPPWQTFQTDAYRKFIDQYGIELEAEPYHDIKQWRCEP